MQTILFFGEVKLNGLVFEYYVGGDVVLYSYKNSTTTGVSVLPVCCVVIG